MAVILNRPYSILITDDDVGCRESLRSIVEPEGYQTYLAGSGEEALDIVRESPVHLAILDVHLPNLSGLETMELVHQFNAVLPCILVTADATEDLMRQAFRARAYSVIPKPISKGVFLYTVVRALIQAYGGIIEEQATNPPARKPETDPTSQDQGAAKDEGSTAE